MSSFLIDTHCHLHDREFFTAKQAEEFLEAAHQKNVRKIICIGTNHEDSLSARDFAASHAGVYWTYGVHPEYAGREGKNYFLGLGSLQPIVMSEAPSSSVVTSGRSQKATFCPPIAIGEVGLDYHYDGYDRAAQIKLFEQMIQLASDNDLPVSFHIREAFDDFFPIISNFPRTRGVVHSFSDNKKNLRRILTETDFYIGVNGMATYSTLPTPPLERILLETDAPFLTPAPFRGIINNSGYIPVIAEWLAQKLAVDFDKIERETTSNATKLFRFDDAIVQAPRCD